MTGRFWAYLEAREALRVRREMGGSPDQWTTDPILRACRFCNVYREDDRVTRWINEHVRVPYAHHPELLTMLAIARWINWPDTLAELMDKGLWWPDGTLFADHRDRIAEVIDTRVRCGQRAYTGAYMIRAESNPRQAWYAWTKAEYLMHIVILPVTEIRAQQLVSIESATAALSKLYGWGGFMGYEVVTDAVHTPLLRHAPDIDTWANTGPGAMRGLNRIARRPVTARIPADRALDEMRQLFADRGAWASQPRFHLREIEHGLCEFDKYERKRLGQGATRLYRPSPGEDVA